jgi:hypothetical protein
MLHMKVAIVARGVCFKWKGIMHCELIKKVTAVNKERYEEVLTHLQETVWLKWLNI